MTVYTRPDDMNETSSPDDLNASPSLDEILQTRRCLLVGGPGGVGKTTLAGVLAGRAAELGRRVRWVTDDRQAAGQASMRLERMGDEALPDSVSDEARQGSIFIEALPGSARGEAMPAGAPDWTDANQGDPGWTVLEMIIDYLLGDDPALLIVDPAPFDTLVRFFGLGPALFDSPGFARLGAQTAADPARLAEGLGRLGDPSLAALVLVSLPRPRPQRDAVHQARLARRFGLPLAGILANMSGAPAEGESWPAELAPILGRLPLRDER